MTRPSTHPARLLRALAACLFVALCLAANGNEFKSWALGIAMGLTLMIPLSWKAGGSLDRHSGLIDMLINGVLALVTAAVLLSVDGVAHPRLSALAALALFATSSGAWHLERVKQPAR